MRFIEVPGRDETVLRGFHYPSREPGPVVLVLTPYGADRYHEDGKFFAARGFHFVSLDSRGRGGSDGEFRPFHDDGRDGHDAIAWLAEQEWSTGDVVTYGGSYSGFTQWAIAGTRPPALRAVAPVAAVHPGIDFPMAGNVPTVYAVQWLAFNHGRRANTGPGADDEYWRSVYRNHTGPFRDLDVASVGTRLPAFQEWLDHPTHDAYWSSFVPDDVDVPILVITGQYDDDQLGALTYHARHSATNLVVGPWDHGGTRSGERSFGGLTFDVSVDLRALHADWYDWVLGRGDRPDLLADPVAYFHIGEGWRHAKELPAGHSNVLPLPATTLSLDPATVTDAPDGFVTDLPDDACTHVVPAHDISGRPRVHLRLSSALTDFDLTVELYLLSDRATFLGDAVFRARYVDLGEPVELTLPFVSRKVAAGDRFGVRLRAPHRLYETNRAALGTVELNTGSYLEMPSATP